MHNLLTTERQTLTELADQYRLLTEIGWLNIEVRKVLNKLVREGKCEVKREGVKKYYRKLTA